MNIMNFGLRSALALSVCCFSLASFADKPNINVSFDAGAEYDSNVNIAEIDTTSGAADTARLLNAKIEGKFKPTNKLNLKAAYQYSGKNYQEYKSFNQDTHNFSAEASYRFSFLTLGLNAFRANVALDDEPFLNLEQQSLFAGKLFSEKVYVRGAITQRQKQFESNSERDANTDGLESDVYIFFNNGKRFLSAGLSVDQEDALDNQFDNDAINYRLRFSNQFSWLNKQNNIQLYWRLSNKDYSDITPAINARRQDKRQTVGASWMLDFSDYFSLVTKLEQGRYDSNLSSARYDENVGSVQMKLQF